MNEATLKVIEAIADDILTYSHLILEDDSISTNKKVNKNTLKNSKLKEDLATSTSLSNEVEIKTIFRKEINFIEWTRPKEYQKQPPIDELKEWAESRGIPTDNETLWKISFAIWKYGHEGRPIIETLEKEIEESFDKEQYDKLFNAVTNELTKYFN